MNDRIITKNQAYKLIGIDPGKINSDKTVHVFLNPAGMLIGADWNENEIMNLIEQSDRIELGGRFCVSMGHGVVATKNGKEHFIESKVPQENNGKTH